MDNLDSPNEEDVIAPYLRDFDIDLSATYLLQKAKLYQLDDASLQGTYHIDGQTLSDNLSTTNPEEINAALEQLLLFFSQWPNKLSLNLWVELINKLINGWVQAVQAGTQTSTVCLLITSVSLKKGLLNNISSNLHLFLFDLVAETSVLYQKTQVSYLLNHDSVTNLPNTNVLLENIKARTADENLQINLLAIRFLIERGAVSISQSATPLLVKKIINLLQDCLPSGSVIYQSGNLQFDVLIDEVNDLMQLNLIVSKIQRCFEQMLLIDQQNLLVSPIIGANQDKAQSHIEIYKNTKTALEHALNTQKDLVIYSVDISNQIDKQKKLDSEVIAAFNNENLELYLQPIVNLPSGTCAGAEVLLRWPNAPSKGIYPSLVVEIINKVGMGKLFTRWLINSTSRLVSELNTKHLLDVYLTLNLRAEDLYDVELPHLIAQSAQFWNIDTSKLVLEITENGILEENEITTTTIRQITENGFKLALDDFGTGYSSMARLRTMPISLVKIDQTFVKNIEHSKEDYEIVSSMAYLATSLGKEVLVEGVEDANCLAKINKIGIKKAQGYYFAKPMPFDAFIEWAKLNTAK